MKCVRLSVFVNSLARFAPVALFLFSCSLLASAQKAGYDLLQTGSGTEVDLSSVKFLSPKKVQLRGVPICLCTGNTDTIMHRTQDVPNGGGKVPVNVYALFLRNSGPVTLKGVPVDVYVTINHSNGDLAESGLPQPDRLPESAGTLTVRTNNTFDSEIAVDADVIIVKAGGNPAIPASVIAHKPAPQIKLTSTNSTWAATPPAGYPTAPCYPANGFYPVPVHVGPHSVTPSTSGPVSSVTLKASPTSYKGKCPGVIKFEGVITVTAATTVKYTWTRSDGAIWTGNGTLVFAGPGSKTVSDTWTLGGLPELPSYNGWETIKILSPVAMESNQAKFSLQCTSNLPVLKRPLPSLWKKVNPGDPVEKINQKPIQPAVKQE